MVNEISYQLEQSGYNELTLAYATALQKHNLSILSLCVGPIKGFKNLDCGNNKLVYHKSELSKKLHSLRVLQFWQDLLFYIKGPLTPVSSDFPGIAISHLANDTNIGLKSGKSITTTQASIEYDFTDLDGSQPQEIMTDTSNISSSIQRWFSRTIHSMSN